MDRAMVPGQGRICVDLPKTSNCTFPPSSSQVEVMHAPSRLGYFVFPHSLAPCCCVSLFISAAPSMSLQMPCPWSHTHILL